MNRGFFVAFEGPDGCGKSTISKMILEKFTLDGLKVIRSREPGGTDIGEKIRNIILDNENIAMDARTEALLYAASRAQHVHEKILPALKEGYLVLSDRYVLSSLIYQGIVRGLGFDEVSKINDFATSSLKADLSIILLPKKSTFKRKEKEGLDRLENEGEDFHNKVLEAYKSYAKTTKSVFIDASMSIDEVFKATYMEIKKAMENK